MSTPCCSLSTLTTNTGRNALRLRSVFTPLLFTALVWGLSLSPSQAQTAIAQTTVAPGWDVTRNTTTTLGFGVAGSHARVGENLDPIFGRNFDDKTPIGAIPPILTEKQTQHIGNQIQRAYQDMEGTSLDRGRAILYNADFFVNKTPGESGKRRIEGDVTATGATRTTTTTAFLDISLKDAAKGTYAVRGRAEASIKKDKDGIEAAYGVGVVRDPVTFQRFSGSESGQIKFLLGDAEDPFQMNVLVPHAFAQAFYSLTSSLGGTLCEFHIDLDYDAQSLTDIPIIFDEFSSASGFATENDFRNFLQSQMTYNPATHTLSQLGSELLVYQLELLDDTPVTMSFTGGAIAGVSAAPEPVTIALMFCGLLSARFLVRRRDR